LAPGITAAAGAIIGTASRARGRGPLVDAAWAVWAGVASGVAVHEVIDQQDLIGGSVGLLVAGLSGLLGSAAMMSLLRARERLRSREPHVEQSFSFERRWLRALIALLVLSAVSAWTPGFVPVLLLLVVATAALVAARDWPVAGTFFILIASLTAWQVLVADFVLSPLSMVGDRWPTTLATCLPLLPALIFAPDLPVWRRAARRATLVDAAAGGVAVVATWSWLAVFGSLSRSATTAQLSQLGEDNDVHQLMLLATRESGTALAGSQQSLDIWSYLAAYFPGPSLSQTSIGSLLADHDNGRVYIWSTALLLGVLAGVATSFASLSTRRPGALVAGISIVVGIIGVRIELAAFEFGFPGQLLAVIWLLAALLLILVARRDRWDRIVVWISLFVAAGAAWKTWSLAGPLFLLPLAAEVCYRVSTRLSGHRWIRRLVVAGVVLVVAGGLLVGRHGVVVRLDTLNLEGPILRAIPIWVSLVGVLILPLALRTARRELDWRSTALVLGTAAATLGLATWELGRVGMATYYSYKLEYFLLALCWGSIVLAAACMARDAELSMPRWLLRISPLGLVLLLPLLPAAHRSYEQAILARGAAGPYPARVCAAEEAAKAPKGAPAVAVGFGSPTEDYLTTKAIMISAGNDKSLPFQHSVIAAADPTAWPWRSGLTQLQLVVGGKATPALVSSIRAAGSAAGVEVLGGHRNCGVT
jgi:hypothetical protein